MLYYFHGSGGGLAGIPIPSLYLDQAMRAERIPPMLIVFLNGMASRLWADAKADCVPMESMLVRDLVPQIDATYVGAR